MTCHGRGLVVVLLLLTAFAPAAAAQNVQAGVKVGVGVTSLSNVSVITESTEQDDGPGVGPVLGLFATVGAESPVAFQPELWVTNAGVRLDDVGDDRRKLSVRYLEVPLLARLRLRPGGRSFYVLAGPTIAWKLSATIGTVDDGGDGEDEKEDIDDRVKGRNAGFLIGAGVARSRWLFEARFTEGMTNISALHSDGDVRTRALALILGLRF